MKKLLSAIAVVGLMLPAAALAETWDNVTLIDQSCGAKFKSNPDEHPTDCLRKCAKKGALGVITSDGTWLKLDKTGNTQAKAALKKTKQKDHVRVNVSGEKAGDEIKVKSLKLAS